MNVDDTPNMRSVLAYTEDAPQDVETFYVDILKMTIKDLTDFLIEKMGLKGPYRMRNLTKNQLYTKEEIDIKLEKFEQFQEGGARICLEKGKYITRAEVSFRVVLRKENKEEIEKTFYF